MSHPAPCGRDTPRWSTASTGDSLQIVASPLSIAGEPSRSACVCVGPPLLASGPSFGSVLLIEPFCEPHLQLTPLSRLLPPLIMPPAQFPPLGLFATIVFANV